MSRTYKDKPWKFVDPQKHYSFGRTDECPYLRMPYVKRKIARNVDYEDHTYQREPSWFRRMFMNRPLRVLYRRMDREIVKLTDLEDYDHVDLRRKPVVYYW